MADCLGRERLLRVKLVVHKDDTTARRISFLGPQHIRGAGVQAKAAVHAVLDDGLLWWAV
jgi:hypothetical protein